MTIQYDPLLTDEQYRAYRYDIILWLEENGKEELTPYSDNPTKGGYATIGAGFRIDEHLNAILTTLGFNTTDKASAEEKAYIQRIKEKFYTDSSYKTVKLFTSTEMTTLKVELNAIMQERANDPKVTNAIEGQSKKTEFAFADKDEVKSTFNAIVESIDSKNPGYEKRLSDWLGETTRYSIVPQGYERLALLSRTYNGITPDVRSEIREAITSGDRAEVWYWLRYSGYKARNAQGQLVEEPGLVKRRFTEAELFGLYNTSGGNVVYLDEAKQIYQMFTRHKGDIRDKEAKYGISFDGTRGTVLDRYGRTALEAANQDYQSIISAYLADRTVDTLQQNLELAKWSILDDLRDRYGEFASKLQDSAIKSTNIYMNPSNILPGKLDAKQYETTTAGENDVMIGNDSRDTILGGAGNDVLIGEGGDDYLEGGKGDDVLIGGSGFDTYYYKAGDGFDQISDTGENQIIIEDANGKIQVIKTFYKTGDNIWTTPDGKIDITHHSPWQIVLEDGSTITLGENLQDGDFGIHLQDVPANPTTTHEIIEDNWYHEPFLGGIIDTAANDHIVGTDLNDTISSQTGGNDWIEAGAGNDVIWVSNPAGSSIIEGGSGRDIIIDGTGNNKIFADTYGEMADKIAAGETAPSENEKGDLISSREGNDFLYGSNKNDLLLGGSGEDLIVGGGGNDIILSDGDASIYGWVHIDNVQGNPPRDYVHYLIVPDSEKDGVSTYYSINPALGLTGYSAVSPDSWSVGTDFTFHNLNVSINPSQGNDVVYAGTGDDFVQTGAGDDEIYAGSGNDVVLGEQGNDTIDGGTGNDELQGNEGNDFIDAGEGNDYIYGDEGSDTIYGGAGNDYIDPGIGNDYIDGGEGNDIYLFTRGYGQDTITDYDQTSGNLDRIVLGPDVTPENVTVRRTGESLELTINGTEDKLTVSNWFLNDSSEYRVEAIQFGNGIVWGVDAIKQAVGAVDADNITGDESDNVFDGGAGDDVIRGEGGNDILYGGEGNDWLSGGTGSDEVYGDEGTDNIYGGDGNDYIEGNDSNDILYGEAGDDYIDAGAGNDYIDSGEGNDTLYGGIGDDTLTGGIGDDTLDGGSGNDDLRGGEGNDTYLFGRSSGQDTISDGDSTPGNTDTIQIESDVTPSEVKLKRNSDNLELTIDGTTDKLIVQDWFLNESSEYQVEQIQFSDGTIWDAETIKLMVLQGTEGADTLTGYNATGDTINGFGGNDKLYGLNGDDILNGGTGSDQLYGGLGNDILDGGADNDYMEGGAGNDTYIFHRGDQDTVFDNDNTPGNFDTVQVDSDILPSDVMLKRGGNDLQITINNTGGVYRLNIKNWFVSDDYKIEQIQFADGTVWDKETVYSIMTTPTDNNNFLIGTSGPDIIDGQKGDDEICGYEGDDTLYGGEGNDILRGAEGNDNLYGGEDNDILDGGDGNDSLYGGTGADQLSGGLGNNTLEGGDGNDNLSFGDYGINIVKGGPGDDNINASHLSGHTYIFMGKGDGFDDFHIGRGEQVTSPSTINFGEGITPENLSVQINNHENPANPDIAQIAIGGYAENEGIMIEGENRFGSIVNIQDLGIEKFIFADGRELTLDQIIAMADNGKIGYQEGTSEDDFLIGSVTEDEIYGGEGNDKIDSRDRNDIIDGWTGNDVIAASSGNDEVYGYDGDDIMAGGHGNDFLTGESGNDLYAFNRGDGQDDISNYTLTPSGETDTISFGNTINPQDITAYVDVNGNVVLALTGTNDRIAVDWFDPYNNFEEYTDRGTLRAQFIDESGNARIFDLTGIVSLLKDQLLAATETNPIQLFTTETSSYELMGLPIAGGDNAVAYAQTGDLFAAPTYAITGTEGDDLLMGNDSDNIINGEGGNDVLYGANHNDTISGGIGNDYIDGKSGDDVLNGGEGNDYVYGYFGNDTINGDAGDDILYGGPDNDIINGGIGNDYIEGEAGDDQLNGGEGNDYVYGYFGNDTINGDEGDDILYGGPDNDIITGGIGNDYLEGEAGDDVLSGGEGNDYVYGYFGNDIINGEAGDDILYGADGNDTINGGTGNDYIEGEAGEDTLIGGIGNDYLAGYTGNDTYIFNNGDGIDAISDCDTTTGNTDTVQFQTNPLDLIFTQLGNDLNITTNSTNDQVTVQNWYTNTAYQTEEIKTGDNMSLMNTQVAQLIQAMATFCTTNGVTWNQAIEQKPAEVQQVLAQYWSQT